MNRERTLRVIGIGGGSGAGKTTLARRLQERLGPERTAILALDRYFRPDHPSNNHPDCIDVGAVAADLERLTAGEPVERPATGGRPYVVEPRPIVLLEGHLALCHKRLTERMDLKVFVDLDPDERVIRRLLRNRDDGGDFRTAAAWYLDDALENHRRHIEPTRALADLIIWGDLKPASVEAVAAAIEALYPD